MKRIGRTALAAAMLSVGAAPAFATGEISCEGVGGSDATVSIVIGSLPVLQIVGATVFAGGQAWSMQPGKGETEIIVGQAAEDHHLLIADFTDPNVVDVLISLRLVSAEDGGDIARAGTVKIAGQGVHAVRCIGP